ncbi:MAG: tail fiber domain-containing protein, partial [Phycisphaerae bacterium]|nr:tail fiber domain-containing protein [Phycisphaerae bacterium]
QPLTAAPYAHFSTKPWATSGNDISYTTGNVGIGTDSPQAQLHTVGGPFYNHARFESDSTEGTWMRLVNSDLGGRDWGLLTTGTTNLEPVGSFLIRDNTTPAVRLMIDPAGSVGIGTTTPGFPLTFPNTLGDKISLWGQSGNHYGLGVQAGLLQIHSDFSASDIAFGYGTSGSFTETMRIKGNGNVGIGTATPTEKLDVVGRINVAGVEAVDQSQESYNLNLSGFIWQSFTVGQDGVLTAVEVYPSFSSASGTLTIHQGEGIGGTVLSSQPYSFSGPNQWVKFTLPSGLYVQTGEIHTMYFNVASGSLVLRASSANPYPGGVAVSGNFDILFRTYVTAEGLVNTEALSANRLSVAGNADFTGNVGIGTTTPERRLHVRGAGGTNVNGLRLTHGASGANWDLLIGGQANSFPGGFTIAYDGSATTGLVIRDTGNVGIGTATPSQRLQVAGNICATGTIGACSDARFKEHVEPVAGALEKVELLRGVTFDWKREEFPDHQFAEDRQLGFIAQEVEKVLPQVVQRSADGYLSVDYGRLTPVLVEAIKELRQDNERLRSTKNAEIQSLRDELQELKDMVRRMSAEKGD